LFAVQQFYTFSEKFTEEAKKELRQIYDEPESVIYALSHFKSICLYAPYPEFRTDAQFQVKRAYSRNKNDETFVD
jgi:hypothetical protein